MHGDCLAYKTNLSAEFKLWKQQPVILLNGKQDKIPLGKKVSLKLEKQSNINYLATPEKSFSAESEKNGGVFYFKTDDKEYVIQISSSSESQVDILVSKLPL